MTSARKTKPARKPAPTPAGRRKKPEKKEQDPSNSLVRLLGLLDLFTPASPAWPIDALIKSRGMSRSTGYRYVKALSDAGLLAAVSDGYYILGPRIIDLDRQIRQCDPLYITSGPIMKQLAMDAGHSVLLCALFSGSVLCVREELTPDSPPNLFTRGQHRPLFQGAASKIMLPYLRPHQLRSIYSKHSATIAMSGLGSDWDSFLHSLARIRRDGFVMTLGEFNPGVIGISAPIFNNAKRILGSVGIAGAQEAFSKSDLPRLFELVVAAGKKVTERISAMTLGMDRPPRGVG